jgi:hypothetical protein
MGVGLINDLAVVPLVLVINPAGFGFAPSHEALQFQARYRRRAADGIA